MSDHKSRKQKGGWQMEDREIIALYLARDEDALRETRKKYGSRLCGLAERLLGNACDAEECESDTYLAAWDLIPPNEPYTYFFPFLARITRHKALDRIRKAGREKRFPEAEELSDELSACIPDKENTEDAFDRKALSDALDRFLTALPAEQRTVFLRRYYFGEPLSGVAARMGWTESKTKSVLFRLRIKLKTELSGEDLL